MRDSLIAILQARTSWYYNGYVQAVNCAAAVAEIDELLPYALPDQEPDVLDLAAVYAIAEVLRCRGESQGDPLDLEEADLLERACNRAADADKAALKVNLADARYMQFQRAQASSSAHVRGALDRAIEVHITALDEELAPPERVRLLGNAGNLLVTRHQLAAGERPTEGEQRDLDCAIVMLRRGAELVGHDDPMAVFLWNSFAAALSSRAGGGVGFDTDAAEALSALRQGVASFPGLAETLTNLGTGLLRRQFSAPSVTAVSADLDEAVTVLRLAADAVPETAPIRVHALGALGEALQRRYDLLRRASDVEACIVAFHQAINAGVAADGSRVAQWRFGLGAALRARFELSPAIDDLVGGRGAVAACGCGF